MSEPSKRLLAPQPARATCMLGPRKAAISRAVAMGRPAGDPTAVPRVEHLHRAPWILGHEPYRRSEAAHVKHRAAAANPESQG